MKTLDRYLAVIFLKDFLIAVFALTTLFVFQAFLGDMFNHAYPSDQIFFYHLLDLPKVLVQMMPPAVLLGTVLSLSSLNRSNELIACYAIGIGIKRIMALLLSIVFIVCCVILVMQDRILPPTHKKRATYYWRVMRQRPDFFLDIKKDKIWYRSKNLIFNLQTFDPTTNQIRGMAVYTFDEDFNLVQTVNADRATYTPQGWQLTQGTVTVFSQDDPFPMTKNFDKKELILSETPDDFREIEKEVDGLRLKELYRYIGRMKEAGADTKRYEVMFHSKISMSLIPLIMCVLAVPFSVRNRREGGLAKDLGLCLAVTFFYWLFFSIGLSLGTNGALPPWLAAWLPSVVFASLATGLILRNN